MDMDPAAAVDHPAVFSESPDDLLDGLDVLVPADRGDHLYRIVTGCSAVLGFTTDGRVTHHLPGASLAVLCQVGVIAAANIGRIPHKKTGDHIGRLVPGDAGHLDLDTKSLCPQSLPPLSTGRASFLTRLGRSLTGVDLRSRYSCTASGTDFS